MITGEEIASWDKDDPDIRAFERFLKRAKKKRLPMDRWVTGDDGFQQLARGMQKVQMQRDYLAQVVANMMLLDERRRKAAISLDGEDE